VRQAEIDGGARPGTTTEDSRRGALSGIEEIAGRAGISVANELGHISGAVAGLPKSADRPSSSTLPGHHLAATASAKSPNPGPVPSRGDAPHV
jgi:hypothetical protein